MKKEANIQASLGLPGLEQSNTAVLNSLASKSGQRTCDRAITDFVEWYCSEPRGVIIVVIGESDLWDDERR